MKPPRAIHIVLLLIMAIVAAACEANMPPPPAITVEITVVSDTEALEQAVAQAVSGTEQAQLAQTATVMAQGGVTLTPSPTLTPSNTPTGTPTRFVTPTRTPLPTDTPTPTFAPYLTSTPSPVEDASSWVRVLHAWEAVTLPGANTEADIFINEERIMRGMRFGDQTTYLKLAPGQIRFTVREVDSSLTTPNAPYLNTVIDVPPGTTQSLVLADLGSGLELIPVTEDLSPVDSGIARMTVIQANPELLPVDLVLTSERRALAYGLLPGQVIGPMEINSGSYLIDGLDVEGNKQLLFTLPRLNFISRLNYVVVLVPYRGPEQRFTDALLFSGNTRLIDTDLNARFLNFAPENGPLSINVDGETIANNIPVGMLSHAIPISSLGSSLVVRDASGRDLFSDVLGPWTADNERKSDKLIVLADALQPNGELQVELNVISQNAPRSAINANLRLIHGLPGGAALSLEILRRNATQGDSSPTWIPLPATNTSAGMASPFVPRAPEVLDVRVVQTGTRNVIAQRLNVELLPGGVYDFLVLPGTETGSARLELLQPIVQFTSLAIERGDPTAIAEAVQATLTAQAPAISPTPTSASTATPTPTPVPTNTPRPTNTPNVPTPVLLIDPAPPNTALGTFTLVGQYFTPGRRFTVRLDDEIRDLGRGTVEDDGTLVITVRIPVDVEPGPHTVQVCVDCRGGGINQAQYVPLLVANPEITPTATPRP